MLVQPSRARSSKFETKANAPVVSAAGARLLGAWYDPRFEDGRTAVLVVPAATANPAPAKVARNTRKAIPAARQPLRHMVRGERGRTGKSFGRGSEHRSRDTGARPLVLGRENLDLGGPIGRHASRRRGRLRAPDGRYVPSSWPGGFPCLSSARGDKGQGRRASKSTTQRTSGSRGTRSPPPEAPFLGSSSPVAVRSGEEAVGSCAISRKGLEGGIERAIARSHGGWNGTEIYVSYGWRIPPAVHARFGFVPHSRRTIVVADVRVVWKPTGTDVVPTSCVAGPTHPRQSDVGLLPGTLGECPKAGLGCRSDSCARRTRGCDRRANAALPLGIRFRTRPLSGTGGVAGLRRLRGGSSV